MNLVGLLRAAGHRQIHRLALRPRRPASAVQRRLQRGRERRRFRRHRQPGRSRRRGGRFPRRGSAAEGEKTDLRMSGSARARGDLSIIKPLRAAARYDT